MTASVRPSACRLCFLHIAIGAGRLRRSRFFSGRDCAPITRGEKPRSLPCRVVFLR
jgi:hypothetical protein